MTVQFLANYIVNDLLGILHKKNATIENCGIDPSEVRMICEMIQLGKVTKTDAKVFLEAVIDGNKNRSA